MTQSVRVTVLGGVVPADLVEQHSALQHRPVEAVKVAAAETELLQLLQEEHPLTRSLAAGVQVGGPLQPVSVDHRSWLSVLPACLSKLSSRMLLLCLKQVACLCMAW